jgi:hypothetical protein
MAQLPLVRHRGLCGRCKFAEVVTNMRGSEFLLCGLSAGDAAFPKYPHLPVLHCTGFQEKISTGSHPSDDGERT